MYCTPFDQYADDIYRRFNEQRRRIYEQHEQRDTIERLKREIIQEIKEPLINEVLARVRVDVLDNASPVIKDLKAQIDGLFNGR